MGRLTEAMHMINCSPDDWNKYSKTHGDAKNPFYFTHLNREELKRLRQLARNKKSN